MRISTAMNWHFPKNKDLLNALQEACKSKVNSHGQAHEFHSYFFLPATASTYGSHCQHENLIQLQFLVTNAEAEYMVKYCVVSLT